MPRHYYTNYMYVVDKTSKKPFFPSKKFVDSLGLNTTACIINSDEKAIGYTTD